MLIGIGIGIVIGAAAVLAYNIFFPASVDKASKELGEEIDKIRK